MKVLTIALLLVVLSVATPDTQFWQYPQQLFNPFSWIRQGKTVEGKSTTASSLGMATLNSNPPTKTPVPLPLTYPSSSSVVPVSLKSSPVLPSSITPPPVLFSTSKITTTIPKEEPKTTTLGKELVVPTKKVVKEEVKEDKLESKMGEIDLGPVITVKVTPPPITTTNAKSPRTTLGTLGSSTTRRALKTKVTTAPLATFYSNSPYIANSQATRHQTHTSPVWTTVPITTRGSHKDKPAYTQPQATQGHLQHAAFSSSPRPHAPALLSSSSSSFSATGTTAALRASSSSAAAAAAATATVTEATTLYFDTTTQEATGTTEEPRDNHRQHDFYLSKREKPQVKIAANISQNLLPLPAGASAALVKPTKYHYYPHNQHIYLLPECAIQQVCNAVYVRLNWTQPLCACPSRYRDPCSASLNSDDLHTTELQVDRSSKRALTLVKTCEPTSDMRICRAPRDWSLLALQNIRTGKSHYLVICRCPDTHILEGPMSHDQPTYASVPGIRVYGMMCVQPPQSLKSTQNSNKRRGRPLRLVRSAQETDPPFPWEKAVELAKTADWEE